MTMQFCTCEWERAKEFISKLYPSQTVDFDLIPKLESLVRADVLRIQDPDFHSPAKIVAGKKYHPKHDGYIGLAITEFKENVHSK